MKRIYKIIILSAAVLFLFFLAWFFVKPEKIKNAVPQVLEKSPAAPADKITGQAAHELVAQKAREWQGDAILSYMSSGEIAAAGTESWNLIFISSSTPKKGYEIKIEKDKIISAEEIDYVGRGKSFPAAAKITQEEAVERVKKMPGYENAKILSVEAVYGPGSQTWYWGIKTSKGIVSVEMK